MRSTASVVIIGDGIQGLGLAYHRLYYLPRASHGRRWIADHFTLDEDPILGKTEYLKGFINDCGWNGQDMMHVLTAELALAELIVDGQPVR